MSGKQKTYQFPIVIEQDEDGYFVSCSSLQGCYSQGETYEEAMANIQDAIRLHVEDRNAQNEEVVEPTGVTFGTIEVSVPVHA